MVTVTESRSSGLLKAKNLENPYLLSKIHMDTIRNILLMVYNSCALISLTSKVRLKSLQVRLQQYMNHELPDAEAGFRKGRGTRDQIANIRWIIKKARVPEKIYFCFIDYAKVFVWITANWGKFFNRWEYQAIWPASWEICMQIKKQQLELDMEQQTGSKFGKEYVKAAYCHSAYLMYMQRTS